MFPQTRETGREQGSWRFVGANKVQLLLGVIQSPVTSRSRQVPARLPSPAAAGLSSPTSELFWAAAPSSNFRRCHL